MKLILVIVAALFATPVHAADCVSKAEMQTIASHFSQFKNLAKADYCYDGSQTSNLIQTIMFMQKTAFAPTMAKSKDELFTGKFAKSWYQYFIGRISDIDVQADCPKGVGAYVYGFGNTMYVCPMILTDSFSAMDRASVFMHEARHIDGFPHTTCSTGARKGLNGACDNRISEGGSYAVTVETYAQLAKYATDLHPALKAYAMASAVTYADEAFEVPVKIDRSEVLVLMDQNKHLYSFDPKSNAVKQLGDSPELGKMIPRAQNKVLIPTDRTKNADYLFLKNEGALNQAAGETFIEYNKQSPTQRAELMDVYGGAQWSAKVYKTKITFVCNTRTSSPQDLALPSEARDILYLEGFSRVRRSHWLKLANGGVYEFGCDERTLKPFVKASTVVVPNTVVRSHKLAGKTFGLTESGDLVSFTGNQILTENTGLNGQIYEIAPHQNFKFMDEY